MTAPVVSPERLQRVHDALRINVPIESLSPMMLTTLAHIAHAWGDRIPANLWPDDELHNKACVRQFKTICPAFDFKRRAAGDND